MVYQFFFSLLLVLSGAQLFAQIDYPSAFRQKLEEAGLQFVEPIDGKYKDVPLFINDYCNFDLAIKSRKQKIEVRYAIKTDRESNGFNVPQVRTMQLLSNVATNYQEPIIAVHRIDEATIKDQFRADWAAIAYFSPKVKFSYKDHCKLLVLHKDGVATVFVFVLFDKPSDELDYLMNSIRFVQEDTEY